MEDPKSVPPRSNVRFTLQLTIFTVFVLVFFPFTGFLVWYNFQRGAEANLSTAGTLMDQAAGRFVERTQENLNVVRMLVHTLSTMPAAAVEPTDTPHPFLPPALEALAFHPYIYGIYAGYGSGGFVQAVNFAKVPEAQRAGMNLPAGATSGVRQIWNEAGKRWEQWQYYGSTGNALPPSQRTAADYDPRTRPWYLSARNTPELAAQMTEPYVFSSLRRPGITTFRHYQGPQDVVVGVDLSLQVLSNLLADFGIHGEGWAVIFDGKGRILASSQSTAPQVLPRMDSAAAVTLGTLAEQADLGSRVLHHALETEVGAAGELSLDNTTYLFRILPLGKPFSDHAALGLVVPRSTIISPVSALRNDTLWISLLVLLVSLPVIVFASRQVSQPLRRLIAQTVLLRNLDLRMELPVSTRISEISQLALSFETLRRAMETFSKYVPQALVQNLIDTNQVLTLGGDSRTITILFTDVKDFTKLTEGMPPHDLLMKTTTYFKELGEVLLNNGATIDKFIGDSIMAFWNAPGDDSDHVNRAARAVLLCRAQNLNLNERWLSYGWPEMTTRFGLHTGEAIVGNVGSPDRMDFTALGDTVNLASRLEGMNKFYGTDILVSQDIASHCQNNFLLRPIDLVVPKGTSQPLRIYELVATLDDDPLIGATSRQRQFVEYWEQIMAAYLDRRFQTALDGLADYRAAFPTDSPAILYERRCKDFIATPPPADWTGAIRYTDK